MPNYNITIDSRFDPYSFEDYLKPLAILQEQHNQAADAYANYLAQSAGMEEALAANPDDIDLLNQYNTYRQTLNNLADDLSKNGISRTTRRGAFQAKADYGNIAKMQEAIKTREALIAEQRALQAKDNSIMFDRSAPNFSIKDILSGKSNYATVSRNAITADVQDRLKNWAKSTYLRNNPDFEKKYGYIFQRIESGNKLDTIELAKLANYDGDDPVVNAMRDIVNDTVKKYSSSSSLWDKDAVESMRKAAYAGLDSTLGSADWSHMQDIELAEARKRAAEKVQTPSPGARWNWITGLSAKNDMDLHGLDDNQVSIAHQVNDNLIKNTGERSIHRNAEATNFTKNLIDYTKQKYSDKDGNLSNDKKKEILYTVLKSCDLDTIELSKDFIDLIPNEYKELKNKLNELSLLKLGNTGSGTDVSDKSPKELKKEKEAIDKSIIETKRQLLLKINNTVDKDKVNGLASEYDDYVSKGAIYSEGAFFVSSDKQNIYDNIMDYLDHPSKAAFYKGQNLDGDFVNDINSQIYSDEDYKKILLDKDGKVKKDTQIGLFTDSQNHLVAVMKNGDKAFQFDLTSARDNNFKTNSKDQAAYQAALTAHRYARALKIASDSKRELTDKEKDMLDYLRVLFNDPTLSAEDIDSDDIELLKKRSNEFGKTLYDSFYDMFAFRQTPTTTTNNVSRYNNNIKRSTNYSENDEVI